MLSSFAALDWILHSSYCMIKSAPKGISSVYVASAETVFQSQTPGENPESDSGQLDEDGSVA